MVLKSFKRINASYNKTIPQDLNANIPSAKTVIEENTGVRGIAGVIAYTNTASTHMDKTATFAPTPKYSIFVRYMCSSCLIADLTVT
jgi:hypothetical protein